MGANASATLVLTVFMTCFGSSFLIGYNIGIFNNPGKLIKAFLANATRTESTGLNSNLNLLYALTNAIFVVAGAIGAFACGWIADRIGRRNGLLVNNIPAIIGVVLVAPCVYANSITLLYVGRFFTGINCGVIIGLASLYLTEIAPRPLRGAIGACHQLAVTLGIMFSYICTMDWSLNTAELWPVAYLIGGVPAVISLVVLPFCPESPRYLFLKRQDEEAAKRAFMKLNPSDDVDVFLGELREEVEIAKHQPKFHFKQLFIQKDLRMPVILACLIQVMQQLSGINAVMNYSSSILRTAGISDNYGQACVLIIGVVNVVVTIVSLPLLERLGRRVLLLWPTLCLAITLILLVIFVNLATTMQGDAGQAMGIVSAIFIFVYIICFALGLGPVPGLIVSEIFRQEPRASAYSLSQGIQWLSNLLVVVSFPSIDAAIGGYSFLPFFVVVICSWVVFFLFMPETKNRTFDEIATDLAFGKIVIGQRSALIESRPMQDVKGNTNVQNSEAKERLMAPDEENVII